MSTWLGRQSALAPQNVVSSVDVVWAVALRPMIEMIKKGEKDSECPYGALIFILI